MVVRCLMLVLGTELGFPRKAICALNSRAFSPAQEGNGSPKEIHKIKAQMPRFILL